MSYCEWFGLKAYACIDRAFAVDSELRDTGASFKLGGRQVAERPMQPLSIVEHFDVFKDRGARLLSGVELQMMGELICERADKALGAGVVEAVALARHAQHNTVLDDPSVEMSFQPVNPRLPSVLRPIQKVKYARTLPTFSLYCAQLFKALRRCDVAHIVSASYLSFLLGTDQAAGACYKSLGVFRYPSETLQATCRSDQGGND